MSDLKTWLDTRSFGGLDQPAAAAGAALEFVASGLLDGVPLPGSGRTGDRWRALADIGAADLTLAKIIEGHLDAVAILAELGGTHGPGELWGVWAADPPASRLAARLGADDTWRLVGEKPWCSGSSSCTHALVSAHADDGYRLFAVALAQPGVRAVEGSWPAFAMSGTDSRTVAFDEVPADPLGGPGSYLDRPGFSQGGIGVAAVWLGGATAVIDTLHRAGRTRSLDPHALAHLGSLDAGLAAARALLDHAARSVDEQPDRTGPAADRLMLQVRAVVTNLASEAIERSARALGPGPFATDRAAGRRISDLWLFIRQSHAERDLAWLGSLALEGTDSPTQESSWSSH